MMEKKDMTRRTALKIMGSAALATVMATTGASVLTSCIVVSMDERPRLLQGFDVRPANNFLRMLWNDEIVSPEMLP